ncbi:MAG: penicillin-binding transpeptidase domain-containing protein [Roseburia sp.]|nr:penicillin-binding transpeptidase domain-containing protein [Roseburia sp.]MCM1098071.1 penicillin-binding transpeptidase domain-containing protein [Ruminococcus flavefaciens]
MFDELKEKLISFITSRLTIFTLAFAALGGILIYRCFDLQIVHGEEYLEDFVLQIEKTRDISSTRGNIYDRNGNVLAYNELAYSVKIEDVFESGKTKNAKLNETILKLIRMIERNGDQVITDFRIVINEDGEFAFSAEGTAKLRFLADVYGKKTVEQLDDKMRNATALEVMEYLSRNSTMAFAIGGFADPEDTKSFVPGLGYTMEDWLKLVTIRYAMDLTSFRKYIGTTVATDVSDKTVAVIMENSPELPGVTIVEDTVRKYVDSECLSHVLGYIGKISSDELTELNEELAAQGLAETYSINDVVGKSGIEAYMETTLQGSKGYEKVVVDNTGKVISIIEREEPRAGQDVYLTIDMELTEAVYSILEQSLAGLLSDKIFNAKEYKPGPNDGSANIMIPIYDVYFALFNNSVIDLKHLASEEAGETEQEVYQAYLEYQEKVYERLREELTEKKTPYKKLSKEYQVYESNIVTLLNRNGVILSEAVDAEDPTQIAWATEEVISLAEYLRYCISQNWIDVSRLELDEKYSDSEEIYEKLLEYIIAMVDKSTDLQKRFYKYMLLSDVITGRQVCKVLCEQGQVEISLEDQVALYDGKLSAYNFMLNRIRRIEITPAQLALDPCNASCVITDVNSGDVLAIVTYPGYDNNKMANSIDAEYYAKLNSDKANPQYNFATQYKAAPGSTFKMVTATAGLMEGVVSLNTRVSCTGTFTEVVPSPRCWRRSGHGTESLITAIRDSCNYFFFNVGYKLSTRDGSFNWTGGLNTLYEYADLYGLTEKSGVEITEASPELASRDPVRGAIGQDTNNLTAVGLARYITTVANSGTCYNLTLLDRITDADGNVIRTIEPDVRNVIEMPEEYWKAIHQGMRQVVQRKVYFDNLAVNVAGKTGTAEQISSRPNHALFVCYAPYEEPEITITTRIPFGYSSDYAAQTTKNIIRYYYGLAEEDELITGEAIDPEGGISNEM